ncbi:hypothetical protein NDU88_005844 [Pleurodeles waltl]|uniref:Uncharacterized protein n=1 Tax=Pleurodeles waltl TaxID=8319 RepID=A0AAV7PJR7_PLEWA|nr:hypothetical protein NDU88_005844 [Pleurodeles waltl]
MALRRPAGGDRPRRWAPEAVSAGSRGTPQTATRGTQPGTPGRARGGPASPARPPAEAGWRGLGAPAGVPPRQDPGAGDRDPAAGDRGWSDLGVGGTKGAELPCDGPSRAPGKAPGRLTIERPSDRRSPGRNPGPQGARPGSLPPPHGRGVFPERLGARAAPPPPVPPGGPGGAARVFETLGPVDGPGYLATRGGLGPTCTPAVRPPGSRVPGPKAGGPEPCQPAGTSPPTCPGRVEPRFPRGPRLLLAQAALPPEDGRTFGGGPSPGWHYDSVYPPRVVPGGRGFRLGRGLTSPPCRSRRVRSRGGAHAPLPLPGPSLARGSGPPGRRSPHPRPVLSPERPGGRGPLRQPGMRQGEGRALCLGVLRSGRQPRAFGLAPWVARAAPPLMILPQVHLRKPCYDFYFL